MRRFFKKQKIKLFISDMDGTLTDGKIICNENGDVSKSFHVHDWFGFGLLKKSGIIVCILTGCNNKSNIVRMKKFLNYGTVNYFYDGLSENEKLKKIKEVCFKENIHRNKIAYIGDDLNDLKSMLYCKYKACPKNSNKKIKSINGIKKLKKSGGFGAVREYIDYLVDKGFV